MTHTIEQTREEQELDHEALMAQIAKTKELHGEIKTLLEGKDSNIALAALAQLMAVIYDDYYGEEASTQDFAMRMAVVHKGRRVLVNGEGQTRQ